MKIIITTVITLIMAVVSLASCANQRGTTINNNSTKPENTIESETENVVEKGIYVPTISSFSQQIKKIYDKNRLQYKTWEDKTGVTYWLDQSKPPLTVSLSGDYGFVQKILIMSESSSHLSVAKEMCNLFLSSLSRTDGLSPISSLSYMYDHSTKETVSDGKSTVTTNKYEKAEDGISYNYFISSNSILYFEVKIDSIVKNSDIDTGTYKYEPANDEMSRYVEDLAKRVNYSGRSFCIIGEDELSVCPLTDYKTGNVENDALYHRKKDIEYLFGIKMDYEHYDDDSVMDRVINDVTSGATSFNLVSGQISTTGQCLTNAGVIKYIDNNDCIDLNREWWPSSLKNDYSVCGKLFILTGPIIPDYYLNSSCVLINKNVASKYGIDYDYLYQTVKSGDWTIDEMLATASYIPENVSGTGAYRYTNPFGYEFIFSSGLRLTYFDKNGVPDIERTLPFEVSALADKLCPIFSNKAETAYISADNGNGAENTYGFGSETDLFAQDRALFLYTYANEAIDLQHNDVSFGILPLPKMDKNQNSYYSISNSSAKAVYIPRTIYKDSFSGTITEALAALGQKYLKATYYGLITPEKDSEEMLEIIYSSKVFDILDIIGTDNTIRSDIDELFLGNNISSTYEKDAKIMYLYLKQLSKAVQRMGSD